VHAKPSHWLHEISIPKTIHNHFQRGPIPPYQPGVLIGGKMVAQLFPQEFRRCYINSFHSWNLGCPAALSNWLTLIR